MSFAEKFLEWLKEVKHNPEGTCVRRFSTLKNIGKKLVEWDILQINLLQKLKINKVRNEKEIKYWKTAEEISKITENTNEYGVRLNYIGFFIGAKISEILNIKWSDIDFC
jgi:integrase